ncbi:RHS repeat-associated core domain-containing protein, partial [Klebsiella pneumoniae]|uniref:RHS repeat-associated core domain-containing protein n=1 Tax=Klebsiella pneumoniae TaxID=573 RepID=UPI002A4E20D0
MGWQLAPATELTKQKLSFPTKTIKEEGYIFVYLSYEDESNTWVYFDDLKVTHTKTNVIQYNEYYPFGLQTAGSWTREGTSNNFLYNSGSELNTTSGWYEMAFRNYDPALGRLTAVDPMATKYASFSGYHYG